MNNIAIIFLVIGLLSLITKIYKTNKCDHLEMIYYDAAGDELPGDQSEACFCKCPKCGWQGVIPSGFQSDAHFENYLHLREQGGSQTVKKITDD